MEIMVINSSEIDKINSSVFEILIKLLIINNKSNKLIDESNHSNKLSSNDCVSQVIWIKLCFCWLYQKVLKVLLFLN